MAAFPFPVTLSFQNAISGIRRLSGQNVPHHRVAASDVDPKSGPVGNSGACDCYVT